MSYKTSFRRKSSYDQEEQVVQTEEQVQPLEHEDAELRKYEARRKITRMVIIRVIMCAMLLFTAVWFEMPVTMRVLLVAVVVVILGTMLPVLSTLKTTLKYEDE